MPGKNERQGRSTNIFFFHEGSLQGHKQTPDTKFQSHWGKNGAFADEMRLNIM